MREFKVDAYRRWSILRVHSVTIARMLAPLALHRTLQARRDRAEMELSSRSHEMLMGEMAVLVRGYRHEQARLYEVNRAITLRLEELETKVRN